MDDRFQTREEQDASARARFLAGDEGAFEDIVEAHKDNVHQFVRSFADAGTDTEDLAQEVFVQAYKSLRSFRGEARFGTWLYSLARHVCLRVLRARYAEKRRAPQAEPSEWLEIPDYRPAAEAVLEDEETGALVRAAVDGLPPGLRAVIVLSHWEDLPYQEISRVLDIPVGTVKSRVHNAVALLARGLRPALERQGDIQP